eukprot:scaffold1356_cov123-Cylindrotheca_fusiformis.AAC.21
MGIFSWFTANNDAGDSSSSPSDSSSTESDGDFEDLMERAGLGDDDSSKPLPHSNGSRGDSFKHPDVDIDNSESSSDSESGSSSFSADNQKPHFRGSTWKPPASGLSSSSSSESTRKGVEEPKSIYDVWKAPEVVPNSSHEIPRSSAVSTSSDSSTSDEKETEVQNSPQAQNQPSDQSWKAPPTGLESVADSASSESSTTTSGEDKKASSSEEEKEVLNTSSSSVSPSSDSNTFDEEVVEVQDSPIAQHQPTDQAWKAPPARLERGGDSSSSKSSTGTSVLDEKTSSSDEEREVQNTSSSSVAASSDSSTFDEEVIEVQDSSNAQHQATDQAWKAPPTGLESGGDSSSSESSTTTSGLDEKTSSSEQEREVKNIPSSLVPASSDSSTSDEEEVGVQESPDAQNQPTDQTLETPPGGFNRGGGSFGSKSSTPTSVQGEKTSYNPNSHNQPTNEVWMNDGSVSRNESSPTNKIEEKHRLEQANSKTENDQQLLTSIQTSDNPCPSAHAMEKIAPSLLPLHTVNKAAPSPRASATKTTPLSSPVFMLGNAPSSLPVPTMDEIDSPSRKVIPTIAVDKAAATSLGGTMGKATLLPSISTSSKSMNTGLLDKNPRAEIPADAKNVDKRISSVGIGLFSDAEEEFGWMPPNMYRFATNADSKVPKSMSGHANPDPPFQSKTAGPRSPLDERITASPELPSANPGRLYMGTQQTRTTERAIDPTSSRSALVGRKQNYSAAAPPVSEISVYLGRDDDSTLGTDGQLYSPFVQDSNPEKTGSAKPMMSGPRELETSQYHKSWTPTPRQGIKYKEKEDPPASRNVAENFSRQPIRSPLRVPGKQHGGRVSHPMATSGLSQSDSSDDSWVPGQIRSQLKPTVVTGGAKSSTSAVHWLPYGIPPRSVPVAGDREQSLSPKPQSPQRDSESSRSNWNPVPASRSSQSRSAVPSAGPPGSSFEKNVGHGKEDSYRRAGVSSGFRPEPRIETPAYGSSGSESRSLRDLALPSHETTSSEKENRSPLKTTHPLDTADVDSDSSPSSSSPSSSLSSSSSSSSSSADSTEERKDQRPQGAEERKDQRPQGATRRPKDIEQQVLPYGSDTKTKESKVVRCLILAIVVVALILVGGIVAYVLTRDSDSNPGTTSIGTPTVAPVFPTQRPTVAPIFPSPTQLPTSRPDSIPNPTQQPIPTESPVDSIDNEYYQLIISAYPEGTVALQNRGSPQRNALDWLGSPSNLQDLSDRRILQRYALATFFYSTKGWEWTVASRWLSNEHECSWFSTSTSVEVCNPSMEYTELNLRNNNLKGTIPIEVFVLLGSLGELDY